MADRYQGLFPTVPDLQGCTDGGCVFRPPVGMHTNGGCACVKRGASHLTLQRNLQRIATRLATLGRDNARMRAKLLELAGDCAECGVDGLVTISNYDGNGSDADDQPCPDCADIREAAGVRFGEDGE